MRLILTRCPFVLRLLEMRDAVERPLGCDTCDTVVVPGWTTIAVYRDANHILCLLFYTLTLGRTNEPRLVSYKPC